MSLSVIFWLFLLKAVSDNSTDYMEKDILASSFPLRLLTSSACCCHPQGRAEKERNGQKTTLRLLAYINHRENDRASVCI